MSPKRVVLEFIAARGWAQIGYEEWTELRAEFPKLTVSTLMKAGIAVEQPVRGVAQHDFGELERSLIEMARVYAERPDLRRFTREQVIRAKDRARWASRNPRADESTRGRKAEMLEWMLVWLDDPSMFETWVGLRRARMETSLLNPEYAEKDDVHGRTDFESEDFRDSRDGEETPES